MSDIDEVSDNTGLSARKETGAAEHILAEIFRGIKSDLNISDALLENAVQRFSMKVAELDDPKKLLGAKSNFLSALKKGSMTIKTLHRGLTIIGATKYTISITGKKKDGTFALASQTIETSNKDFIDLKDERIDGLLIKLFKELNHISLENNKDFAALFDDYADLVGILPDNISRSKERSSIKKDIFKAKKISWKNLVKGILFLGYTEFDIVIAVQHRNGNKTLHSKKVILRGNLDD